RFTTYRPRSTLSLLRPSMKWRESCCPRTDPWVSTVLLAPRSRMKAIQQAIFALLGHLPPTYVQNPRVVALFGAKVTPLRAWACFIAFMANSHLALARDLPAAAIKTLASFLGHVAGYLFIYL